MPCKREFTVAEPTLQERQAWVEIEQVLHSVWVARKLFSQWIEKKVPIMADVIRVGIVLIPSTYKCPVCILYFLGMRRLALL